MMPQPIRVALVGVFMAVAMTHAQNRSDPIGADFVEVEAIVTNSEGEPVRGLRQEDFALREDGRAVPILTFEEVSATGVGDSDEDGRTVVVLLDDTTLTLGGEKSIQALARFVVAQMRPADHVGVVRLTRRNDEPYGSQADALTRIAEYHPGAQPFFGRETVELVLKTIARLSRQLEPIEHRRKAVICIGTPFVFDIQEPPEQRASLLWEPWLDVVRTSARSNVAVYVVDPSGVGGARRRLSGAGIAARTGGFVLTNSNDFERAIRQIWQEASHYYLIGYAPVAAAKELHSISAKVLKPNTRVRVRGGRSD